MAMNTEDSLREYLRLFVKVPLLGKIGPLARTFDFVADAAPGVKEILAVGKLCHEVRERHYDLVVVDAEATGHIVAQIGAPQVIRELVKVGLVRDQTEWMLDLLHDPAVTGVAIVTTPEEMPVTETIDLIRRLEPETGVDPSLVVANRVLRARFDDEEAAVFEELDRGPRRVGRGARAAAPPRCSTAARITDARRRTAPTTSLACARPPPTCRCSWFRSCSRGPPADVWSRSSPTRWPTTRNVGGRLMARTCHHAVGGLTRCSPPKEMVLVCGSGGVGKTTTAAAMARRGGDATSGRVLVLTVDPARRLADALGIGALGNEATKVPKKAFRQRASTRAARCGRRCSTPRPGGTS